MLTQWNEEFLTQFHCKYQLVNRSIIEDYCFPVDASLSTTFFGRCCIYLAFCGCVVLCQFVLSYFDRPMFRMSTLMHVCLPAHRAPIVSFCPGGESPQVWERPTKPARKRKRDGDGGGESVRARHILAKHNKSRNPKSWRQDGPITRSLDEAVKIIEGHRAAIVAGEKSFEEIARTESDCR